MIVALAATDGNAAAMNLAQDLADLRTVAGNKVLLVSRQCTPCRADARKRYDDVVIDVSGALHGDDAALALAAAGVIVVLVDPAELGAQRLSALLTRIKQAQRTNPGAAVLVTVAHGRQALSAYQAGCILVFVAQIPSARLSDTLVLDETGGYRHAHGAPDEVRGLYRQVFEADA